MSDLDFDLVVIGGGSAGFSAALRGSELGARVALLEGGVIGGTCLNRGCIPTKNLLRAAEIYHDARKSPIPGIEFPDGTLDMDRLITQKDNLVEELRRTKYLDVLEANPGIRLIRGEARFVSGDRVSAGDVAVRGGSFVVATGASPDVPSLPGLDSTPFLTSTAALELRRLPSSLLILGGRFVALEFAQMFARFGSRVTVLQRNARIVPDEEPELSDALRGYLEQEGIEVHTGLTLVGAEERSGRPSVSAERGRDRFEFEADCLLVATGRRANTAGLDLEVAGVSVNRAGFVEVDDTLKTSAHHVWAAGDVIGPPMLVTAAAYEGGIAAENALSAGERGQPSRALRKVDHSATPHAIFTSPQLASVGLTERRAGAAGMRVRTTTLDLRLVPKAVAIRDPRGLVRLVAEAGTGRLVGAHILSPQATDIIAEAALAVRNGMTARDIVETIHVYPTMAEALKLAAQSFDRDVAKLSCCAQ